jgi:hypothetical protein
MPEKIFVRGIPDDLWRAIKSRASLEGITVSQALQAAIRAYLAGASQVESSSLPDPWKGMIAVGEGDRSDVSERHDHYLAEANRNKS